MGTQLGPHDVGRGADRSTAEGARLVAAGSTASPTPGQRTPSDGRAELADGRGRGATRASEADTRACDAALVVRARTGDAAAFGALVRRHLPAAYAVARSVVAERADAEDVCQDAFAAALAQLETCRPAEMFRGWLLQIVRNRAISLLRWQRVRTAAVLGDAPGETDAPSAAESPLVGAERADLRARLNAALAALSDEHRTVVLLHDIQGWNHRDIAELLGVAEGTSRSALFYARRRLRTQLAVAREPEVAEASDRPGRRPLQTVTA
jgi:RNA polymerase sigma-70 factor (ECF subfamily)